MSQSQFGSFSPISTVRIDADDVEVSVDDESIKLTISQHGIHGKTQYIVSKKILSALKEAFKNLD